MVYMSRCLLLNTYAGEQLSVLFSQLITPPYNNSACSCLSSSLHHTTTLPIVTMAVIKGLTVCLFVLLISHMILAKPLLKQPEDICEFVLEEDDENTEANLRLCIKDLMAQVKLANNEYNGRNRRSTVNFKFVCNGPICIKDHSS